MNDRLKRLGADGIVYGTGIIAAKGLEFLLLPVYTRIFSPSEYGSIEMLSIFGGFLSMAIIMGMNGSQGYYFFKHKQQGHRIQSEIICATLQWRFLWGLFVSLVIIGFSPKISSFLFSGEISFQILAVVIAAVFISQLTNHSVEALRLLGRPWRNISVSMIESIVASACGLVLIIYLRMGISGYVLGLFFGSIIALTVGLWQTKSWLTFSKLHTQWWPPLLKYGTPLLLNTLGIYLLYNCDKWLIYYFLNSSQLGIYAIGAKFGMIGLVVINTFRQAIWPIALEAMHAPDGPEFFRSLADLYIGFGAIISLSLTSFSPFLVSFLTTDSYQEALPLVGILSWCPVFYGFMAICGVGIWKAERTATTPLHILAAAGTNLLLSLILIPIFGLLGAATASVSSFIVWNAMTIYWSERFWPIGYRIGRILLLAGLGISATIVITFLHSQKMHYGLVILTAGISIISLLVIMSRSFDFRLERLKSVTKQFKTRA